MEHLLVGISRADPDAVRPALGDIEDIATYESIIGGAMKTAIPGPADYTVAPVTHVPQFSGHAAAALKAADAATSDDPSVRIESRHLLAGALTITDCGPVKMLIQRGIVTDLQPRVVIRRTQVVAQFELASATRKRVQIALQCEGRVRTVAPGIT
jgi:hypothetical protein